MGLVLEMSPHFANDLSYSFAYDADRVYHRGEHAVVKLERLVGQGMFIPPNVILT